MQLINAWTDPWIPRGLTRRPVATTGLSIITTVSELINPITETWDEELIRDNFTEEDAREILCIPVRADMEDWLAWHYDSKGQFSVKSAYRVGVTLRESKLNRDAGPSAIAECQKDSWKHIWDLELPGKVKIFLWRLAHNSLPTRMNIKRKGIELDTRCPVCNRLDEDGGHIFLKCKFVKHVWQALDLEQTRMDLLACANAREVVSSVCLLPPKQRSLTAVMLWDWWTYRNKVNAGEARKTVDELGYRINKHLHDFMPQTKGSAHCSTIKHRWELPQQGYAKVNCDASFIQANQNGAFGLVVRDDTGD